MFKDLEAQLLLFESWEAAHPSPPKKKNSGQVENHTWAIVNLGYGIQMGEAKQGKGKDTTAWLKHWQQSSKITAMFSA